MTPAQFCEPAQNTGAIARKRGPQKGLDTFVPLHRFPDRRPKEVTVVGGIDDTSVFVRAERHIRDGRTVTLDL